MSNLIIKNPDILSSDKPQGLNIENLIRNPESVFANFNVDFLVDLKDTTIPLIGKYSEKIFGKWDLKTAEKENIFVYEYYFDNAKKIVDEIRKLADKLFENPSFYDDTNFCNEYFLLVKEGYKLLKIHRGEFENVSEEIPPVSFERAGLVCTRAFKQLPQDAQIPNEIKIIAKRVHLKNSPENFLAATITVRDRNKLLELATDKDIEVIDTVIATGVTTLAFAYCTDKINSKPKNIIHTAINSTKQGIIFVKKHFEKLNIQTTFHTLGIADELNEKYYLIGPRAVGDAGQVLRHFLPKTRLD